MLIFRALLGLASILILSATAFSQLIAYPRCSDCSTLPKVIHIPKPAYPSEPREAGVSGKVVIQVLIDESGRVIEVKALSGPPALINEASDAARKATFQPARSVSESRKPTKSFGMITYNFVLEEETTKAKSVPTELGIVNGRATYLPRPLSSKRAGEACASGEVRVAVAIGESGNVLSARGVSGNRLLISSAVRAAKKASFRQIRVYPPVTTRGLLIYKFVKPAHCN